MGGAVVVAAVEVVGVVEVIAAVIVVVLSSAFAPRAASKKTARKKASRVNENCIVPITSPVRYNTVGPATIYDEPLRASTKCPTSNFTPG